MSVHNEAAGPSATSTPITEFYNGAKILVTGATGFIGKALVEKLLRSCQGIDTIYYLVRTKRGVPINLRHDKLLASTVFDRIREEMPDVLKKIMPISGDISKADLGLSSNDRDLILKEVDVIFHSAATTRFHERIQDAFNLNTVGTLKILELCKNCRNLKAFVHVSTAYSNADKYEVMEEVYPPPAKIERVLEICKIEDEKEQLKSLSEIQGKLPNTYTLTKALTEFIVNQHAAQIPISIVRPSIVCGALQDPTPGWVDNISGLSGVVIGIARGTVKSAIADVTKVVDLIPVDLVVNTLIASAWRANNVKRTDKAIVYNCTSGTLNPFTWQDCETLLIKNTRNYPTRFVTFYPGFKMRTNVLIHELITFFYQILPAIVVDIHLYCTGRKKFMYSLVLRFIEALENGRFVGLNEWKFHVNNMEALQKCIAQDKRDSKMFPVDVRPLNWDSYMKHYWLGIRRIVLMDPLTTLPSARRKVQRIYWISTALTAVAFGIFAFILYHILSSVL